MNLLLFYIVRIINIFQTFQKLISILGDTQIPYVFGFLYNFAVTDITFTALAVFIGKYNLTVRAIVYESSVSEYKTFFEHFEEDPLCPFVVIFVSSIDDTVPVKREADFF